MGPKRAVKQASLTTDPIEEEITEYLGENPDFFIRHRDILLKMLPPERKMSGDGVVDLMPFLLDQQRVEIDELTDCVSEIVETSRGNMSTQARCHAAVLNLIPLSTIEQLVQVVEDVWPALLDIDVAVICYEPIPTMSADTLPEGVHPLRETVVENLIGIEQDVRLIDQMQIAHALFGDGPLASAALARLRPLPDTGVGLLALGSSHEMYNPEQGTELVTFLARAVEMTAARILQTEP